MISLDDEIADYYSEELTSREAEEQRIVEIAMILRDNFMPMVLDEDDPYYLTGIAMQIWCVAHNRVAVRADEDAIVEKIKERCNTDIYWNRP